MKWIKPGRQKLGLIALLFIFILSSSGCQLSLIKLPSFLGGGEKTSAPPTPSGPTPTPMPMAQVTFIAVIPEPLGQGESLAIAILDEVTGLALNSVLYPMEPRDPQT